jgi:GH15 family glucan-1,4-alpha-glucosidase
LAIVQAYGSKRLDAGLLLIPLVGFLPASDPRVQGAVPAVEDKLLVDGEFVLRYEIENPDDGLPEGEGAGLSTITYCKGATQRPENYLIACSRAAMTWVCWPKRSIR